MREWSGQYQDHWLRVKAVKLMLDGVIESHTAAMLDAYSDASNSAGSPTWSQSALNDIVLRSDRAGLQVLTHAIGDRAVRMALDAYEAMFRSSGRHDARPRVEHIETIAPSDIPRFGKLGVIASFTPIHADPGTSAVWTKAIGPERASRGFAWRSLERSGATLAFSSDWPATISVDPIRGLHCAVNRQTVDGQPPGGWFPDERVALESALRAYTSGAAFASFEEREKGTLAPGMLADFVVLTRDLFRIAPREIATTRVALTVTGGRVVFRQSEPSVSPRPRSN